MATLDNFNYWSTENMNKPMANPAKEQVFLAGW
jgi:hypothetical protein